MRKNARHATKVELELLLWELILAHVHRSNQMGMMTIAFEEEYIDRYSQRPSEGEKKKFGELLEDTFLDWVRGKVESVRPRAEKVRDSIEQTTIRRNPRQAALESWRLQKSRKKD